MKSLQQRLQSAQPARHCAPDPSEDLQAENKKLPEGLRRPKRASREKDELLRKPLRKVEQEVTPLATRCCDVIEAANARWQASDSLTTPELLHDRIPRIDKLGECTEDRQPGSNIPACIVTRFSGALSIMPACAQDARLRGGTRSQP